VRINRFARRANVLMPGIDIIAEVSAVIVPEITRYGRALQSMQRHNSRQSARTWPSMAHSFSPARGTQIGCAGQALRGPAPSQFGATM